MGLNNSVMWTHSLMPVCGKHPNRKQWNIKNLFFLLNADSGEELPVVLVGLKGRQTI